MCSYLGYSSSGSLTLLSSRFCKFQESMQSTVDFASRHAGTVSAISLMHEAVMPLSLVRCAARFTTSCY